MTAVSEVGLAVTAVLEVGLAVTASADLGRHARVGTLLKELR